jgi:hypothetical protein
MLADLAMRRRDYDEVDLFRTRGRYGDVPLQPLLLTLLATALGWGLVTNSAASWLEWQGYLLGPFGLGGKTGDWAYANLGVLLALAIGFLGTLGLDRGRVRGQEEQAPSPTASAEVLST